ncbi:TetR family transcriptional regulator [Nakamurella sp. YIM 132087]|uniref:TetR family transcriptional regulator n=1 Tax=Nakamurella alba TaxID=2665158 RepID=A0A7K1FPL6_9ACTN|nr:TetR/AcrR family transcriptional regulator [Nakamurella alba]MTD15173.1 TetR family transcriptional regulator [Nakamurella alba]
MRAANGGVDAPAANSRTEEIRQVAAQLFEQSGYSATTMSDIASAVGLLPGSLYHHFESKEEIAVGILAGLDQDLTRLIGEVSGRLGTDTPEDQLREVARQITALSLRSGAALRLYSYAAPTVATEKFRSAVHLNAPALQKLWKRAVDDLVPTPDTPRQDVGLLRFALQQLTLNAALNVFDTPHDADEAADRLCSMLLQGVAIEAPDDRSLNASVAMRAAQEGTAGWQSPPVSGGTSGRDDIVIAARGEFARRGYQATTVRDIAEAAGVRMGTLYRRISSKEEVLAEILLDYGGQLDRAVRSVLGTDDSVAAKLDALALIFVKAKRRFRLESDIVKFGSFDREPVIMPLADYHAETRSRLVLLEDLIAGGVRAGELRSLGDPGSYAAQIRYILWTPYQDYARAGVTRTHQFLRNSLLRGFLV